MEYTSGVSSWRRAVRRAAAGLRPGGTRRRNVWSLGVPVIALTAGLLFTTTATTADGTALRDDRRPRLAQLIADQRERLQQQEQRVTRLHTENDAQTAQLANSDAPIADQRRRADSYRTAAGFTAVRGPGVAVELDDAPRAADGTRPGNASNDDLVVHQSDVQAVVNALWAGGAEAMSIMDVRVISTSAVRCVGNTLLLHGRVYSPPFVIKAIGDPTALQRSLDAAEGVQLFRNAVASLGLGYRETVDTDVTLPAYDGSSALRSARVPE